MSLDILLLCARPTRSAGEKDRLGRLLTEFEDWDRLVRRAVDEGVSMLGYRALKEFGDRVPDAAIEFLRQCYYQSAARYLRVLAVLGPVVATLRGRGFRFAFTKGLRLAEPVYGDFALRAFSDVDIMAHPADGAWIEAALVELGFKPEGEAEGGEGLSERRGGILRDYSPYYRKGELLLEVHYDALGLQVPLVSEADVWAGVRHLEIGGFPIPVLAPEAELCHLCLHAMQHSYALLVWLVDIAEFAARPDVDWDGLAGLCRREGVGGAVYYGLYLAGRLWPGAVPREAVARLRPGLLQRWIFSLFWPEARVRARRVRTSFPYFMPSFFALVGRRDVGRLVRAVFRLLFPSRAWVAHYYGIDPSSPRGALRLAGHYAWRVQRPFTLVARRLLHL